MNDTPTLSNRWLLLAAAVFALGHTQSHLYYSNQNQYFLKGLANAGTGDLRSDWLANTTDPVPVFSAFITLGQHLGGGWVYHATFFFALMLYYLGLRALLRAINLWNGEGLFLFLMALTHCAASRLASDRFIGTDYPWFLHVGLANQYILGPGLQPSVVGVGLLWSLVFFLRGRVLLAVAMASGVNIVHSTYLLPSALLVFGMLVSEARLFLRAANEAQRERAGFGRRLVLPAAVALAVVAPVLVYNFSQFGRADGSNFAEAQRLLADERLAHHTRPARWFDGAGAFQLVWLLLGWLLMLRTKLATVATVAFGIALVLSILAIVTGSPTLALLFPWRLSAVFVPISTAVILTFATQRFKWEKIFAILATVLAGLSFALVQSGFGYAEPTAEDSAMEYIKQHAKPGDLYVIPAKLGKPTTARGVYSNTFAKPFDPAKPVYFEFARFRLHTKAALYIDFKSIPYRSDEVIEWHRRLGQCEKWFADNQWAERNVVTELRQAGVTHVVAPISLNLGDKALTLLYEGGAYRVYQVK